VSSSGAGGFDTPSLQGGPDEQRPQELHLGHAAWVGNPEVVGELLDRGADPNERMDAEFDTPLAIAALGSRSHEYPGRDYVAVAELLVEVGNEIEPRFLEVAEGPLYDWLEERLG